MLKRLIDWASNLKFNLWPPYVSWKVKHIDGDVTARAWWFFIRLVEGKSGRDTLRHEEAHVGVWWGVTIASFLILLVVGMHWFWAIMIAVNVDQVLGHFVKPYKMHEEAYCYAKGWTATMLSEDQYIDWIMPFLRPKYGDEIEPLIRKYMAIVY